MSYSMRVFVVEMLGMGFRNFVDRLWLSKLGIEEIQGHDMMYEVRHDSQSVILKDAYQGVAGRERSIGIVLVTSDPES